MKKGRSLTVRHLTFLSIILMISCQSVFAGGDDWFLSETGRYSFIMPEGFSKSPLPGAANQETFIGTGIENFNVIYSESSGVSGEIMFSFSKQFLDEIIKQYTEIGISEESIEKEGTFTTEENDMKWVGISMDAYGMMVHQCFTFSDEGESFSITFTEMAPEDEQLVLNSFTIGAESTPESSSDTAIPFMSADVENSRDLPAQTETTEYTLMDGKLKLEIPAEFNVLIKGVTQITDELAASMGVDKDRLELYLSLQGSDLIALRKGESLSGGNSGEIHVRIKPDKYKGINNLADLPDQFLDMTAQALISGFTGTDEYQLYKTSEASFIVFDFNVLGKETRYATVFDESMIYLYYHVDDGDISEQDRQMLQDIADTIQLL